MALPLRLFQVNNLRLKIGVMFKLCLFVLKKNELVVLKSENVLAYLKSDCLEL